MPSLSSVRVHHARGSESTPSLKQEPVTVAALLSSKQLNVAGAGFDAGAAAEEAKRRAEQAKQAAAGWFGRARGVLSAVGREVTEVILPKTGAQAQAYGTACLSCLHAVLPTVSLLVAWSACPTGFFWQSTWY